MFAIALYKISTFATVCTLPGTGTNSLFSFPHWWQYLGGQTDGLGKCSPVVGFPDGIWAIGLAILNMLLILAGIVAVISIIIAGFEYTMTQGNSEKGVSARKRIVNSLIGLAIVLIATGIVSFIGNSIN